MHDNSRFLMNSRMLAEKVGGINPMIRDGLASLHSRWRALIMRGAILVGLLTYGLIIDPDTGSGGFPCLWMVCFGFECQGCGLSRAGALLLHGRLKDAACANWVIFPIILWISIDFIKCAIPIFRLIKKNTT